MNETQPAHHTRDMELLSKFPHEIVDLDLLEMDGESGSGSSGFWFGSSVEDSSSTSPLISPEFLSNSSNFSSLFLNTSDPTPPFSMDQMPLEMREMSSSSKTCVLIYSLIWIIASTGNLTVFASCYKQYKKHKSRITLLILHLSVADLIVTFCLIPIEIAWRITIQWYGGNILCKLCQFVRAFGLYLSSMVLICVSLDRFFSILFPLKFANGKRRVKVMLVLAWVASGILSLPQAVIWSVQSHPQFTSFKQCRTSSSQDVRVHTIVFVSATYLAPLLVIIFTYTAILLKIVRKSRQQESSLSTTTTTTSTTYPREGEDGDNDDLNEGIPPRSPLRRTISSPLSRNKRSQLLILNNHNGMGGGGGGGDDNSSNGSGSSNVNLTLTPSPSCLRVNNYNQHNNSTQSVDGTPTPHSRARSVRWESKGKRKSGKIQYRFQNEVGEATDLDGSTPSVGPTPLSRTFSTRSTTSKSQVILRVSTNATSNITRAKSRTLRLTIVIVVVFVLCWTPYVVMTLWYMLDWATAQKVDPFVQEALFLMAVANSSVNPLIYGSFTKNCCGLTKKLRLGGSSRDTNNTISRSNTVNGSSSNNRGRLVGRLSSQRNSTNKPTTIKEALESQASLN